MYIYVYIYIYIYEKKRLQRIRKPENEKEVTLSYENCWDILIQI